MARITVTNLIFHHIGPISFTVEPAQCSCLTGPSGGGKSLLLRAMADLDPHEGNVALDGDSSQDFPAPEWRKMVGMLPTESQWWYETVGEHFSSREDVLLEMLGFPQDVMEWTVRRLSAGEKRRLGLVRLLSNKPRALLLDEPTANLDPKNVVVVEEIINGYRKTYQAPVLWVSHDRDQTSRIADNIMILEKGKLLEVKE